MEASEEAEVLAEEAKAIETIQKVALKALEAKVESLKRIALRRGKEIKSLAFRVQTLENKLASAEAEITRHRNRDLNQNEKWAKTVEKAHLNKKSLLGQIKKLEKELEEARRCRS